MGRTIERGGRWKITTEQIKKFLPNAYYIFFYGALGSLFPFLNLYYRSIGLNAWQIGVLGGIRPLVALFSGPFWCYMSNQYKLRKFILLASLISWIAFTVPLGFVSNGQAANCPTIARKSVLNKTENASLTSQDQKRGFVMKHLQAETHARMSEKELAEISIEMNVLKKIDASLGEAGHKDNNKDKEKKRIRRNSDSNRKVPRFISLEQSFVNSYSTFGMKLHKRPYKTRTPYDFKSRGSPYVNKRDNPFAKTIFIELFFLVFFGEIFQSPTDDLNNHYDGTFLEHLGVLYQNVPNNSLYSAFGIAFGAFFTGLIIAFAPKYTICGDKYSDYRIAFYFFGVLMVLALVISATFRLSYRRKKVEFDILGSVKQLCDSQHTGFVLIVLVMGTFRGVLFNFLYWNTAEIGGSELIVGVTVVSQYLSDMIMNFSAPVLMTYIGYVGMIYCGLASYALRFIIYSWLSTPGSAWAIPSVELLQGISNSTAWSAFILYVTNYTPRSTYHVGIFILQALYLGLGSCIGGLLGGGLIQMIDTTVTFRIFALISLLVCLLFVMMQPTGMNEVLPSEVEGLSYFAEEDDYSSLSDDELLNYEKRVLIYKPPKNTDEDGILETKKTTFPPSNPPFVPMFMTIVKTQTASH